MANQIKFGVGFDVKQSDLNQLKSSLQQLKKLTIGDIMKINSSDAASARTTLNDIKKQAINVEQALRSAFNAKLNTTNIESFNKSLKDSGSSIEQVYQKFSKAGTAGENAFRSLSSQVLSTNIQLKESHNLLDKMATTLANTVKWNIASSAVNGLSRSVSQAWGYVKSLDTSLNDIRIVTGKSAEQMENFAAKANDVAQSLGKTTVDYTNAALIYAQQGLSDKEIEERAAITLKTANVTGQSTDAVSEELTAVWNGYKVNAQEAQLYVDRLAAVAATTASDLEELSTGMSKVASAAATMGVNEEQLAAQLSTIISVTREAPETIGTSLKTIYARISDIKAGIAEDGATLGYYSGKMAEFGVNVLDANGNLRDMGDVMEEIGGKWGTLTREQQIYLTQTMAGQRQYSRLLALFDNWGEYEKALNTAQNAAGTLQEQQDIYMESTAAHLQTLKAAVENIYDSFADTDSINSLIDAGSDFANIVASMVDSLGGGVDILKMLGSVGAMVFSTQIAKGLNTTITNFEIARNNAKQFDEALQATKQWQGIPGLEQLSKDLLNNRERVLELAKVMSPEEFKGMQKSVNDMTQLNNQVKSLTNQQKALDDAVQEITAYRDEWENLQEVLENPEVQEEILERFQNQEQALQSVEGEIKTYRSYLNDLAKTTFGKKTEEQIEKIDADFIEAKKIIKGYIEQLQGLAEDGYLKRHSEQIQKLKKQLESLDDVSDFDVLRPKLQEILGALEGIPNNARGSILKIREALEIEFSELPESLRKQLEEVLRLAEKGAADFQAGLRRQDRGKSIETYAKLAGSVASVGMAIQQVQNLGSIIKDDDLEPAEKALQVMTNLGFTISMLLPAMSSLLPLLKAQKAEALAAAAGQTILAAAENAHSIAAMAAAAKQAILNAVMEINPFVAIATAVLAAAAALSFYSGAAQKAAEKQRELNKEAIDEENKIQDQIRSHEDLYASLEQLNEQRKNGQITKEQLKSGIDELVKQYDLEESAVDKLTGSYEKLNQEIERKKREDRENLKDSTEREKSSALANFRSVAQSTGGQTTSNGIFRKSISRNSLIDSKLQEHLGSDYTTLGSEYAQFKVNINDENEVIEHYEKLSKALSELREQAVKKGGNALEQLTKSPTYQQLNDYLKELQESYEALSTSVEENNEALTEFLSKDFDFENIENVNQYITKRQEYIKAVMESSNMDLEEASNQVDKFLRQNEKEIYSRFDAISDYIEKLKTNLTKLGQSMPSDLEQKLGNLTSDSIAFLDEIELDNIGNWQELRSIIEYLQTADLSSLQIVTDLQGRFDAASEQYNQYSSLADQIKDSKKQTISKKEFESLDEETQKFFDRMANGTYKMTGDAEEFYETVNSKSLEGFRENIEDLQGSTERLQKLQGLNYNDLLGAGSSGGDWDYVNNQLDYLTEAGYNLEKIIAWKAELGNDTQTWSMTTSALNDIAEAMVDVGDQTDKFTTYLSANEIAIYQNQLAIARSAKTIEELKGFYENGQIAVRAFTLAAIELDESLDLEGLDPDELDNYADHLQQVADKSEQLANSLKADSEAAQIVAKGIMKMNDAIDALADNWEEWSDVFKNSSIESEEYANAMGEARGTIADLLDISKDYVSEDFIKNHLDEITQAAQGSETAIDGLKDALADDVILRIIVDNGLESEKDSILSSFQEIQNSIPDVEVGATFKEDDAFVAKMQQFLNSIGATAEQANAIFDSLGFETEFATEQMPVEQRVPITYTVTEEVGQTQGTAFNMSTTEQGPMAYDWSYPILKTYSYQDGFVDPPPKGVIEVPAMSTNGKTPKISSLTKKASGSSSNYSSRNSGGKSPGSSKSSSSSKSKSSQTSKKDTKKSVDDGRDIYHDINIELKQNQRALQRIQKQQDRLYGKDLLDNLNKQSELLEEHKDKLRQKLELQKADLAMQKANLAALGVTFDQYGNIANYMGVVGAQQNNLNALIQQYNALVNQYNNSTDETLREDLNDRIEETNKRISQAQENLKDLQSKISAYDSLKEAMEDVLDDIEEDTQKQIEINIKKFRMEVQIRLEMGEAERDWNEFKRNVLEHTDIIKDTNFSKIFKDAQKDLQDAYSYFSVNGTKGTLEKLTEQLQDTRYQMEQIDKLGESAIYGDNKAQAMEDLTNDLNELMSQLEDIESLVDSIDQAYLNTIDDISDQFNEQIENYEFIGDLIEHQIDLMTLLYGDENYAAMNNYYNTLQNNQMNEIDFLRKEAAFWEKQWKDAQEKDGINSASAKKFEENYKEVLKNLNQEITNAAKTIQDKYINSVNEIFDNLAKKLTDGKGLEYLDLEWDLMNKKADEYLDTVNAAFAVQGLENKFNKALNDNANMSLKNQQALQKLRDQQIGKLKAKEKLTQYDVDLAEKKLQVEQARIALEETRNSKTSMRLKRDSQGNYSYEYVADQNNIADAEQNFATAQNDLYNFNKDAYRDNLNDYLSIYQEMQEKLLEIKIKYKGQDDKIAEQQALIREYYGERLNALAEQNQEIRTNLKQSAFDSYAGMYNTDVANFQAMSQAEQNELMTGLVPAWNSGIQIMMDKIVEEGGLLPACETAFKDLHDTTEEYERELDSLARTADIDLEDVRTGVVNVSDSFEDLILNNNELIGTMGQELSAIQNLRAEAHSLVSEYNAVYNAAKQAVSAIHDFTQAQRAQAAAAASAYNSSGSSGSTNSVSTRSSSNGGNSSSAGSGGSSSSSRSSSIVSATNIEGIAGNIWVYGGWGDQPTRSALMRKKFGTNIGNQLFSAVQAQINNDYRYNGVPRAWEYYKKFYPSAFLSGGYTGSWGENEGRIGILHQKELVLNADDTKNLLDTVSIMRSVMGTLRSNMAFKLGDLRTGLINTLSNNSNEKLEQNVHIEASFPSVNSKREIEEALSDLVDLAAQRTMRR